jgi:hypothetical protein
MLLALERPLEGLEDRIRRAPAPSPVLISDIVAHACTRLPTMKKAGKFPGFDRLIEAEAWFDVALALLKTELPSWSIRRIIYDGGEWFCSLTNSPNLPTALDDTADAHHQSLPLAILGALLEARKRTLPSPTSVQVASENRPNMIGAMSCENFA